MVGLVLTILGIVITLKKDFWDPLEFEIQIKKAVQSNEPLIKE